MFWFLGSLLLAVSQLPKSAADIQLNSNVPLEPYDLLYDNAIEAYYIGDWKSVILNMERALRNKGALRRAKAHCCLLCANQTGFGEPLPGLGMALPGMGPVEDLGFFQKVVKRAACIHECEMEKVGPASLHKVSEEVALEFRKRSPYNYLQVAYFKINRLEKAVAAANTFYIANPEHEEMRQNLEYYKMMAGVQESDFKDLEAKPHMDEFRQGVKLYTDDQFQSAIEPFERALEAYFSADLECRAICEGAYDYDGYNYLEYSADLFQAITGEKYEKAIECAKTYLLFRPNDDVMIQNLAYYSAVLGEERAAAITARENIQQYMKQSLLEKELLYFAYDIFGIAFVDPAEVRPKCGRVVGFGAGKENPHGVKAVTKGQRCAVAMWFTLDPRHNEKERIQAEELLKMLSSPVDAEFQEVAKESPAESKQTAETPGNAQTDVTEETDSISEKQAPVTEVQTDSESGPVSDSSTINASVSSAETEQKVSESRDPTAATSSALDSRDRKEEL
ncbi:Prolyl 3-hydroxylase 1 [Acipenser ruthenus]|uniref:Prolyl 3-hydroxylase 1 n=1 Tax=Acipenser ruthenus TaxID=7906 RepID=A0A444UIC6_ACIRT|nr:Prolyl 3-hydroxylase 1 [Acipenser ruthenus]